ncbi:MAG: hypothetical protein KDA37_04620 [Planctomycetales bacterium]|nr:hypothetical protein [Planctomycetales bacterium]
MKQVLLVLAVLLSMTLVANSEELKRLGLDDSSQVSPRIEADEKIKVEGKSSIRIATKWPVVVCMGEVEGPDVDGAKLVYSAQVKTDLKNKAVAYLEMWAHVDHGQYFSRGQADWVGKKSDWETIRVPFLFKPGQKPEKVTLNLVINGVGTVWVDDIVLSKEPLKAGE